MLFEDLTFLRKLGKMMKYSRRNWLKINLYINSNFGRNYKTNNIAYLLSLLQWPTVKKTMDEQQFASNWAMNEACFLLGKENTFICNKMANPIIWHFEIWHLIVYAENW